MNNQNQNNQGQGAERSLTSSPPPVTPQPSVKPENTPPPTTTPERPEKR